jgi:hypothetical protein
MEKITKYSLLISLLSLIILGFSCETKEDTNERNRTLNKSLIIIDKTLSADIDKEMMNSFNTECNQQIAMERLIGFGDQVKGYLIHSNTLSNSPFTNVFINIKEPDVSDLGGISQRDVLGKYKNDVQKIQAQTVKAFNKYFPLDNEDPTNRQTDLWAIFELMSDYFGQSSPEDDRLVIIVSDMIESMRGPGRRDFHGKPIKNKVEAEALAKEDAQWIKNNLAVDTANLQNVKIRVWPPITSTEKSNFQNVRYYWDALFAEFGLMEVSYFE